MSEAMFKGIPLPQVKAVHQFDTVIPIKPVVQMLLTKTGRQYQDVAHNMRWGAVIRCCPLMVKGKKCGELVNVNLHSNIGLIC